MDDVLKLKKQLSRTRVITAILSIFCVLLFIFAHIQKLEADRSRRLANEQRERAEQARLEAERQRTVSMQIEVSSKQALEDCLNKK